MEKRPRCAPARVVPTDTSVAERAAEAAAAEAEVVDAMIVEQPVVASLPDAEAAGAGSGGETFMGESGDRASAAEEDANKTNRQRRTLLWRSLWARPWLWRDLRSRLRLPACLRG